MQFDDEVRWFLALAVEENLCSRGQIIDFVESLKEPPEVKKFYQLAENSLSIKDSKLFHRLRKEAHKKAKKGEPSPEPPTIETKTVDYPAIDWKELTSVDDSDLRKKTIDIIKLCQECGASDLHLTAGTRPRIRHHRKIIYLSDEPLPPAIAEKMNLSLLSDQQKELFELNWDLDYALDLSEQGAQRKSRYRVNLLRHRKGISAVYHMVPDKIPELEDLGFPNIEVIRELLTYHNGILLITGPVGSGKTTTLASLVHELNEKRKEHIIVLEDPIEVIQESGTCIISQREIGSHTKSFGAALKSALREDPDVIVVGEMRNLETIEMAITAAETGHLVIATLHTRDASFTLNRILDVFPPRQQNQIRAMVADSLRGILCQRLLPARDGSVVMASELLICNAAVSNIIREGKETGLRSAMQTGKNIGMRTMQDSIKKLLEEGKITSSTADEHL